MNIQISVSIWTVICFLLLMLILHNLLFKPILKVMDRRRARIENAAAKKAEHARLEKEHASALLEQQAAFASDREKQINAQIEAIRADSKKAVECAKEARLRQVEEYRAQVETERIEILDGLSARKAELAAIFAESITKE